MKVEFRNPRSQKFKSFTCLPRFSRREIHGACLGRSTVPGFAGSPCLLVFGILLLTFIPAIQSRAVITFERTYGGALREEGFCVQQTYDGGYIIAGRTWSFGAGQGDIYLIKTDSLGNAFWERTYGGSHGEFGHSVQQTFDGGYVIAGYTDSFGGGGSDIYMVKTDSSGDTAWTRAYGGSGMEWGYSVQQIPDGGYIIAGDTYFNGPGFQDVYLIKTDSSGDVVWTKEYGGASGEGAYSLQHLSDGGYIIAGYTFSFGAGVVDVYLIRTDSSGEAICLHWGQTFKKSILNVLGSDPASSILKIECLTPNAQCPGGSTYISVPARSTSSLEGAQKG